MDSDTIGLLIALINGIALVLVAWLRREQQKRQGNAKPGRHKGPLDPEDDDEKH